MPSLRLTAGLAIAGLLVFGMLGPYGPQKDLNVTTFRSPEDFRQYLNQTPSTAAYWSGMTGRIQEAQQQAAGSGGSGQPDVSRYSTTNVQEQGIQEPDILKTNGRFFFYAPQQFSYPMIATEPRTIMPPKYRARQRNTTILNTLPADNITAQASISGTGKLLLMDDVLVRMHGRKIEGFDVSQPSKPEQRWSLTLNGSRVAARSYGNTIYIVTRETIEPESPCPLPTATGPGGTTTLPCTDIYHPEKPVAVDTTYTIMTINPTTGRVQDTTGFVGSRRNSIIYMSKDALYITYLRQKNQLQIVTDFLAAEADQLFDQTTAEKIQKLPLQDMSRYETRKRISYILDNATQNMTYEQRQRFHRKIENAFKNYTQDHRREFTTTGIVKIPAGNIHPAATGTVPGRILNQFSIDEYRDHLRVATTIGIPGSFTSQGSVNDVYVLDKRLSRTGAVKGLGMDERIYAVRFIRDQGYVVTFRRIDPFHVLDLSQPSSPELKGTLKLPGFSSYLHPLSQDRILGIGEEDGQVKAVVFDVSNASSPVVEDDLILEDYSSEISQTHHAFMIDRKHRVFFLPGTSTGYIISYRKGLEIVKTVSIQEPLRARYVNDYLYIFGTTQLTVVDETDWTVVDTVQLAERQRLYR